MLYERLIYDVSAIPVSKVQHLTCSLLRNAPLSTNSDVIRGHGIKINETCWTEMVERRRF